MHMNKTCHFSSKSVNLCRVTHSNVRHSVYSILRELMGTTRLMKLRLGMLTGVAGQRGMLALLATRAPQEPKFLRERIYGSTLIHFALSDGFSSSL